MTTTNAVRRQFKVRFRDPKTANTWISLPILRTEAEVARLRETYAEVEAHAVEGALETPNDAGATYRRALMALITCYRDAEARGNPAMAQRAQNAVAALLNTKETP